MRGYLAKNIKKSLDFQQNITFRGLQIHQRLQNQKCDSIHYCHDITTGIFEQLNI